MPYCEECSDFIELTITPPYQGDVERLAELIAEAETDAALLALRELLPDLCPLPSLVKRRIADRRAQPATRAA